MNLVDSKFGRVDPTKLPAHRRAWALEALELWGKYLAGIPTIAERLDRVRGKETP